MGEVINFRDALNRLKKPPAGPDSFPANMLSDLNFNECFGFDLDYCALSEGQLYGLLAWIAATRRLASWGDAPHEDIGILLDYYERHIDFKEMCKNAGRVVTFLQVSEWLDKMKIVGLKYGFPVWVKMGSRHCISVDDLIECQASFAKYFAEKVVGVDASGRRLEELYALYCLRIDSSPFDDLSEEDPDVLNDYVADCRIIAGIRCDAFEDILTGNRWIDNSTFDKKYEFCEAYADDGIDDCLCIRQKKGEKLGW